MRSVLFCDLRHGHEGKARNPIWLTYRHSRVLLYVCRRDTKRCCLAFSDSREIRVDVEGIFVVDRGFGTDGIPRSVGGDGYFIVLTL
jgi:hypothetical protein